MTKQYIVVRGDTMSRIASANGVSLSQLKEFNLHIPDISEIYAEHGGDVVFLEQPGSFEMEYAALRRELILAKMNSRQAEVDQLKVQLEVVEKKLSAAQERIQSFLNIGRQISSLAQKIS